ncbi:putative odorant-binding protein A10 [Drosophila busckii]|uniref:putative odorant-binding protein A10 n=1 Tax=Drosophila busckii TaxID=30019 RepID=UPI001433175B|nr:putative odorant-binding protein A10 [Drosophila busckii]
MSHLGSAIKMPLVLQLLLLALCQAHPPTTTTNAAVPAAGEVYDNKFDNVDLDEILSQERLLNNYIKCLEGLGPCTPDAKMLKEILPDAMLTDCEKCTEKQKYGAEKVTRHLIDNRPEDWQRLEKIYDPQGGYRLKYEETKNGNNNKEKVEVDIMEQGDN